ncbi:MAG: hypothetical protein AB7F88_09890 [Pyrinomonadaceae bacterium]
MKFVLSCFLIFTAGVCSLNSQTLSQSVEGRFVAVHRFGGFHPREPVQQLILQAGAADKLTTGPVMKAVFLPRTGGLVGTVEILDRDHVDYSRLWKLILRSPTEREKRFCDFDSYLRTTDNNVDTNSEGEPTLNFYSTQFDAWMIFPKLETMPCVIIESLTSRELTIRSRKVK